MRTDLIHSPGLDVYFEQLRQRPLLSREDEKSLSAEVQHGDMAARIAKHRGRRAATTGDRDLVHVHEPARDRRTARRRARCR